MEYITGDRRHGSSIGDKDHLEPVVLIESVGHERDDQQNRKGKVPTKLQQYVDNLGFEERGIERVLPTERTDMSISKIGTMWMSANMTISTFAIGALAHPVFNLGFVDTVLTIVFVNFLSILPVCFFSTLGPRFGLRQMVLSRFWFGYYGVKLSKSSQASLFESPQCSHHHACLHAQTTTVAHAITI